MIPEYIGEIVLNTGTYRRIYLREIDKTEAKRMRDIARQSACKSGVMIDNWHFKTVLAGGAYFCTVSEWLSGCLTPMLITCGAREQMTGELIWMMLQMSSDESFPIISRELVDSMPDLPFIATAVLPNKSEEIGELFTSGGSGALCAALGWGILFPEACP